MNPLIKASLVSGLTIFAVGAFSILIDAPFLTLILITIIPGPVYAAVLLLYSPQLSSVKATLFFLAATALYYAVIYWLNIHNYTNNLFPFKILIGSITASTLLKMVYDTIIYKFQVKNSLLQPAWIGCKAALFATMAAIAIRFVGEDQQPLHLLVSIGLLSIFPLWQYFFSLHIVKEKKTAT